jgi:hypothetical protein
MLEWRLALDPAIRKLKVLCRNAANCPVEQIENICLANRSAAS